MTPSAYARRQDMIREPERPEHRDLGEEKKRESDIGEIMIMTKDHTPNIISEIFLDGDVNVR